MAYTTVFSSAGEDLFLINDDFKNNKLATGLKTLTTTSAIPSSNVTIASIVFSLGVLRLQGYNASGQGNYFFLTNKDLSDYSDYSPALPSGAVDYIKGGTTFLSDGESRSITTKTINNVAINCFRPASSDSYSSVHTYTITGIQGNTANASLFKGKTSIGLNMVGVTGNSGRWKFNYEGNTKWTCTVTWDYTNTKCSPPTSVSLNSTVVGKKGKATLSWNSAKAGRADNTDGANTITGYRIFRNGVLLTTVNSTSTGGSITVEAPETNGATYKYTIQTIGSKSGFEYSNTSTASATLKASWTDIKISSFTCQGKTGPLYVGASSATLDFSWSATGGTNNAINKYILKRGSETIATITDSTITSYTLSSSSSLYKTGTYTLEAVGASASTTSSGISITVITGKSSLNISGLTSKTIKQDTIQINIETLIPANYNCSEIQYNLGYKQPTDGVAGNFYTNFIPTWQNTITLTDKILRGEKFKLYVRVRYMGIDGGSTYKNYAIIDSLEDEYIIIDEHNPAVIESIKDKNSDIIYSDGKGYGYGTIELTCTPASQKMSEENALLAISGKISSHILIATDSDTGKQLIKKTVSISPGEGETTDTVEMSLASIADGTKLNVQIQSIDEYGLTNLSNLFTIVKFKLPEITSASNTLTSAIESNIKKNNLTSTAKIIPYVMAETELGNMNNVRYSMELKALNEFKNFNPNSQWPDASGKISATLSGLYCKENSEDELQSKLYTEVITNQNPTPPGVIVIKAWYNGYDSYKSEASINFNFDYFTPLSDIEYTLEGLSGNSDIGYYLNPFTSLTVNVDENEWHNAAGELNKGASITTALYQGTTLLQDNTYEYAAYNPSDITKTFKIRQVLSYSGTDQTLVKEKEFNVILAKWNNKETVKIKSVSYTENPQGDPQNLFISLLIPIGNLGSTTYKNGNETVNYYIYDKSDTENELTSGTFTHALDSNTTEVIFNTPSITNLEHNTRTLYATLTFENTSEGTVTLTTADYLLSVADVTLAMRKNKIGINVEKSYGVDADDLKESSILQVNGLTDLANTTPIIHVSSPNSPSSEARIRLMQLSTQGFDSVFSTDGTKLFISNLDINNINNRLTITTSDAIKIAFRENDNQVGFIHCHPTTKRWSFVSTHFGADGNSLNEYFSFPAPDETLTSGMTYYILTTRKTVTVAQGGTGASDAATARDNLKITPANIGAVPTTRTVNGKALSENIELTAADVGAVPNTRTVNGKALSQNITLAAADVSAVPTNRTVNGKALSGNITLTAPDVGIFYATSLPAFSASDAGKIYLVKKG